MSRRGQFDYVAGLAVVALLMAIGFLLLMLRENAWI